MPPPVNRGTLHFLPRRKSFVSQFSLLPRLRSAGPRCVLNNMHNNFSRTVPASLQKTPLHHDSLAELSLGTQSQIADSNTGSSSVVAPQAASSVQGMVIIEELGPAGSTSSPDGYESDGNAAVSVGKEKSNGRVVGKGGPLNRRGLLEPGSARRDSSAGRRKRKGKNGGKAERGIGYGVDEDSDGDAAGCSEEGDRVFVMRAMPIITGIASFDADDFMAGNFFVDQDDDDNESSSSSSVSDDDEEEEDDDEDYDEEEDSEEDGNERKGSDNDNDSSRPENRGDVITSLDADDFMSGGFMALGGYGVGVDDDSEDKDDDDEDNNSGQDAEGARGAADSAGLSKGGVARGGHRSNAAEEDEANEDSDDDEANTKSMDLRGLAEADPEFFEFLQKEEPALLDFDPMEGDDDQSGEEEGGGGDEAGGPIAKKGQKASRGMTVTMAVLRTLRQEAFDRGSVKGVRRIVKVFRCACHLGDEAVAEGGQKHDKFIIPSSEVYNELMVCTLEGLQGVIIKLLFPEKATPAITPQSSSEKEEKNREEKSSLDSSPSGEGAMSKKRRRRQEEDGEGGKSALRGGVHDKGAEAGGPGEAVTLGTAGGRKKKRKEEDVKALSGAGAGGVCAGGRAESGDPTPPADTRGAAPKSTLVLTKDDFRRAALLPEWKAMQPTLYSFFKSLLHVLGELHDRALLAFILSRLEGYVPFLVPFPGLARAFLKALLELWGDSAAASASEGKARRGPKDEDNDELEKQEQAERVRLLAYLRVRQMAEALPFPFVESCMKGLYLAFAKRARAPPPTEAGKVSLRVMEGCVVELYGMDVGSAYQNAFLYIRQLSLLLRQAMQQKTKDSVQAVRRWQVATCLRIWTGVLAAAPAEDELRMLIFPLAQVIGGILRLCVTLRHSPLMFQLVRMRQRLAAAAELYVPCSSPLLEVLRSPALSKKAAASTEAPPNIPSILRLGKAQVLEGRAQGAVVEEALRLLGQEMDLYRYAAAFPELVIPVLGHLKKLAKSTKVSKWRMITRGLVETLEARATWAAKARLELGLKPSEAKGLEVLRPKGAPTMRERLGESEAAVERTLDEVHPASGSRATARNETSSDDDEGDSDDGFDSGASRSAATKSASGRGDARSSAVVRGAKIADEDIAAPDLVEELGAWSDDDWA